MKTNLVLGSLLLAGVLLLGTGCTPHVTQTQRDNITMKMTGAGMPLAKCYAELLTANPTAAGSAVVAFRVQPNSGRFTGVKMVRSQIKDPAFNKCVVGAVSDLYILPAPSFIIEVTEYPIGFKPVATK
jgi:hypothetical protein